MAGGGWVFGQSPLRKKTGPNPTDGGKSGSKGSVLTEGHGIPLAVAIERADVTDQNPPNMCLDKGYD